ncbi:MAG: hypothetical protein Q4G04_03070 [bacterium]|nr:hypothetical protein [bacterium]
MKKFLKRFMTFALVLTFVVALTGCQKETNTSKGNGSSKISDSWPTGVSYVPDIKYEGKGSIVKTKEDTEYGNQYMIYIKGADLESANAYVDKLYSNGYEVMNMFSDEGKYLQQPKSNSYFKMGYENEDDGISVQLNLHDNQEDYNLVITWADMNS